MNKKGFTLMELLATITLMGILATLSVVSMDKYINKTKKTIYKDYEKTLKEATTSYLLDNTAYLPQIGDTTGITVTGKTLTDLGYIDDIKDPKDKTLTCNNNSYVTVIRKENVEFNMDLEYKVCLVCSNYKSSSCGG